MTIAAFIAGISARPGTGRRSSSSSSTIVSLSEGVADELNFASPMPGIDPAALIHSVAANDSSAAVAAGGHSKATSR